MQKAKSAEAIALKSQLHLLQKDEISAAKALDEALKIDQKDHFVLRNLARYKLRKNDIDTALKIAQALYQKEPNNPENMVLLAALLSQKNSFNEALELLKGALSQKESYAEAYANIGLIYLKQKQNDKALESLQKALFIKPHLTQLYRLAATACYEQKMPKEALGFLEEGLRREPNDIDMITMAGELKRQSKEYEGALEVLERGAKISPDNAAVLTNLATVYHEIGEIEKAKELYKKVISINPKQAEVYNNLGRIYFDSGILPAALECFEASIKLGIKTPEVRVNLGNILREMRIFEKAIEVFTDVLQELPNFGRAIVGLAKCYSEMGFVDKALSVYKNIDFEVVRDASLLSGAASAYNDVGEFEISNGFAKKALEVDPDSMAALSVIPLNKKMNAESDGWWIQKALSLLESKKLAPPRERYGLLYSIGKYFDDTKEYEHAFGYYREANELKKAYSPKYLPDERTAITDKIISSYKKEFFLSKTAQNGSALPLFIIGMLRSGTSLTEQILSSHPLTFGAGELYFWNDTVGRYRGEFENAIFLDSQIEEIADSCIKNLKERSKEKPDAIRVIDKMPGNFMYVGLIHKIFPNAKFIHTMRNPIDTCLSNYFQNFGTGQYHSNDLEDLVHYYKEYRRLMEHWRAVLPEGVMLDVRYEDIVEDQEGWSRKIIEHIGLEWDERCLLHHKTDRKIGTSSNWQARQPVYKSSKERWKNYEKFVEPLLELLEK